jgi:hypothetical protein
MVSPAVGKVILVPFPFSDLSQSKLRPAVVLADAGRGDRVSGGRRRHGYVVSANRPEPQA